MFLYPVDFLDYVAPGNEAQAVPKPYESKSKEGNEDEKRCLEDMQKTLTCAAVLVERLCYAKKGERHGRKLKQSLRKHTEQILIRGQLGTSRGEGRFTDIKSTQF